ncbi:MAG: hypothetical protein LBC98_09015 [Prevotellaceae bacterium]|jgi:hypothetical protein|nr:hypothetical protein [Prevotellaceae bacterium]
MKKIILLITTVFCAFNAKAQSSNIPVSIVVPQQVDYLDDSQTVRLGKKMLDATTRSGLSASTGGSSIIMLPIFSIAREDIVEGGMQNLVVVDADISFVIKNLESDLIYSSYNRRIRGSGSNRTRAINEAISAISVNDAEFNKFIERGREKILAYYESNCSTILLRAESCAKRRQFEEAIALIASIPDAASCYSQALSAVEKFYSEYQNQQCKELLQKAQALYAAHKYNAALSVLYDLKTFSSACASEAKALMTTIEGNLSAEEQRQWDFTVQQYSDRTLLQEKRIEAIQAIASAYYGRQINYYNYNLLPY